MHPDAAPFVETACHAAGCDVTAAWKAEKKLGDSFLGKRGWLLASSGTLVFVEDRFGKTGDVEVHRLDEMDAPRIVTQGMRAVLEADIQGESHRWIGLDRPGLEALMAAAQGREIEPAPDPSAPVTHAQSAAPAPAQARAAAKPSPPPAAPPVTEDPSLTEALFEKIDESDVYEVRRLLDRGAPLEGRDDEERTPLLAALEYSETEIARLLLDRGADVSACDEDGATPLMNAADSGETLIVEILIERGADVNARDKSGETALHNAASNPWAGCATVLLAAGADPDAQNEDGETPLMQTEEIEVARVLVEAGADLSLTNEDGQTALDHFTEEGEDEIAGYLREKGG